MTSETYESYQTGSTNLVNFKTAPRDAWSTYIGRYNSYYDLPQSEFANPFTLDDYSRDESVDLYTLWFSYQVVTDPEFEDAARNLQGETLACWCVPDRCHGIPLVEFCESGTIPTNELKRIRRERSFESFPGVSADVKTTMKDAVKWLQSL
jgi:hypothetical protein